MAREVLHWTHLYDEIVTSGLCTGQQQKLAIPVFSFYYPGWQLGDAVASVTACSLGCADDTKAIHISL